MGNPSEQPQLEDGQDEELRITLRLPKSLHDKVARLAKRDKRSVNAEIEYLIETQIDGITYWNEFNFWILEYSDKESLLRIERLDKALSRNFKLLDTENIDQFSIIGFSDQYDQMVDLANNIENDWPGVRRI